MIMNQTKRFLLKQAATSAMLLGALTLQFAPLGALALDRQILPENTQARSGFTHVMKIVHTDVTNAVIHSQWRLFPQTGNAALGDAIDTVGIYLKTPFWVSNANAGSNGVFLNVGHGVTTNSLLNNFLVGSNYIAAGVISNAPPVLVRGTRSRATAV